jgi:hypothetical protein
MGYMALLLQPLEAGIVSVQVEGLVEEVWAPPGRGVYNVLTSGTASSSSRFGGYERRGSGCVTESACATRRRRGGTRRHRPAAPGIQDSLNSKRARGLQARIGPDGTLSQTALVQDNPHQDSPHRQLRRVGPEARRPGRVPYVSAVRRGAKVCCSAAPDENRAPGPQGAVVSGAARPFHFSSGISRFNGR